MATPDAGEPQVLIPRSAYQALLRESRQIEVLGYLIAALGTGGGLLLLNAGDLSFWVVVFIAVGVVAAVWAVMTRRRHGYRISRGPLHPSGLDYVDRNVRPALESPGMTGGEPQP